MCAAGFVTSYHMIRCWCCRRAKRLKKLRHLLAGSGANAAGEKYRKHTYILLLVVAAAHIAFFAVMYQDISAKYQ